MMRFVTRYGAIVELHLRHRRAGCRWLSPSMPTGTADQRRVSDRRVDPRPSAIMTPETWCGLPRRQRKRAVPPSANSAPSSAANCLAAVATVRTLVGWRRRRRQSPRKPAAAPKRPAAAAAAAATARTAAWRCFSGASKRVRWVGDGKQARRPEPVRPGRARRSDISGYAASGAALGLTFADRAWCK